MRILLSKFLVFGSGVCVLKEITLKHQTHQHIMINKFHDFFKMWEDQENFLEIIIIDANQHAISQCLYSSFGRLTRYERVIIAGEITFTGKITRDILAISLHAKSHDALDNKSDPMTDFT